MTTNCITCRKPVPAFSPNPNYCSKECEKEGGDVMGMLKNLMGI